MWSKISKLAKIALIILIFSTHVYSHNNEKKFVIGSWDGGFFSMFNCVLNHLAWCDRNNLIPVVYWGPNCHYYQNESYNGSNNVWEYYFNPVSSLKYELGENHSTNYHAPDKTYFNWYTGIKQRYYINSLIKKYIIIKDSILDKISKFISENLEGKKTIGIHLRGTDKSIEELPVPIDFIINQANKYAGYQFLVATDDQRLFEIAKKKLNGKIVFYDSLKSLDGEALHFKKENKALMGEQVLIECKLLSFCDKIIHTSSNVSTSAYYFNPNLKGLLLINNGENCSVINIDENFI